MKIGQDDRVELESLRLVNRHHLNGSARWRGNLALVNPGDHVGEADPPMREGAQQVDQLPQSPSVALAAALPQSLDDGNHRLGKAIGEDFSSQTGSTDGTAGGFLPAVLIPVTEPIEDPGKG